MQSDDLVLVTGASGFIAKHVIKGALARGYRVRGTLRRPECEAEIRAAVGESGSRLSFVKADLLSDDGWPEALAGCRYVLHLASPFRSVRRRIATPLCHLPGMERCGCFAPRRRRVSNARC